MAKKPAPLPDSLEPLEIALDAERGDPAPDSPARTLLLEQIELTRDDRRHRRLQIASERLGAGLKALTGLAGLTAAAVLAALAWDAHQAHGLVIEPFSVTPDMAARGLTGQVAATQLQDRLATMQDETNSQRAPESIANNWAGDIKVEIPSTGVSIGDLRKVLRQWLGHETHVTGEIVRAAPPPGGGPALVTVTARVGDHAGRSFTGPESDLEGLEQKAAESVYAISQPYRYGVWLGESGRGPESIAHFRRVIADTTDPSELAWDNAGGLAQSLINGGDWDGSLAATRAGEAANPAFAGGWVQEANLLEARGRMEAAHRAARQAAILIRGPNSQVTPLAHKVQMLSLPMRVAEMEGDFAAAVALGQRLAALGDYNGIPRAAAYLRVSDLALLHELTAARDGLDRLDKALPAGPGFFHRPNWAVTAMLVADAAGDGREAMAQAARVELEAVDGPVYWAVMIAPYRALGIARTGDLASAQALIAATAPDCYPCLIARARIAAMAGDRAGADRWFAEALRQGPSLPFAAAAWAQALLDRGDLAGAIAKARLAAMAGPRFADPQQILAEALLRQGDLAGAEAALRKAVELAPRWGRAHAQLGEALMKQGRFDAAHAEWTAALGMDLTPGERARVQYWLKGGH